MGGYLDSKELKIDVGRLMRDTYARERLRARLLLSMGEEGLHESPAGSPADLDLVLESSPDGIRVTGTIAGTLPLECTRCTAPVDFPFEAEVDEFFTRATLPLLSPEGREEVEVPREESYRLEGDELELNEMVNDQIILSLPIRRLCREDCRGVCPSCGADLNREECGCGETPDDPRLEKLRQWLDREGEE